MKRDRTRGSVLDSHHLKMWSQYILKNLSCQERAIKYYLDKSDKYRRTLETNGEKMISSKLAVGGQEWRSWWFVSDIFIIWICTRWLHVQNEVDKRKCFYFKEPGWGWISDLNGRKGM